MSCDIAVCLDSGGETSTLEAPCKIVVYRKKVGQWKALREKSINPADWACLVELRRGMGEIVSFLGDCKIFVGRWVTGLPYFELEKNRCSIWEYEGKPGDFLDLVLSREEEENVAGDCGGAVIMLPVPMEYEKGCYTISIKEIQEGDTGFTSKQVLMPLLKKGGFFSLGVLCNHVPPWLEGELSAWGLNSRVDRVGDNESLITIAKKNC